MRYGQLIDDAYTAIQAASDLAARTGAEGQPQVADVLSARDRLLHGLIRLTRLLEPRDPKAVPDHHHLAVLRRALSQARVAVIPRHSADTEMSDRLGQAADAISLAGDILASHVDPVNGARTPDGAAISHGLRLAEAVAELARLTGAVITMDQRLLSWMGADDPTPPSPAAACVGAIQSIRAWLGDADTHAAIASIAHASRGLSPVRGLTVAPAGLDLTIEARPIDAADCTSVLADVRLWLFRQSDKVETHHLAATTRTGLLIAALAERAGICRANLRGWRQAAASFLDLAVPAPAVPDAYLDLMHRFARVLRDAPADQQALTELARQLPPLAGALRSATTNAVGRGTVLVKEATLDVRTRRGVRHALTTWTPARLDNPAVGRLLAGLSAAQSVAGHTSGSQHGRAFQSPLDSLSHSPPTAAAPRAPAIQAVPHRAGRTR